MEKAAHAEIANPRGVVNRRGFAYWNKWLPLFDAFLNPSEDFRIEVLTVGTLLQGSELALAA